MFGKKNAVSQVDVPNTVIGKGISLETSSLTGSESVRIDGTFYGNVNLEGSLILGETGTIEGNIHAKYIILAGFVKGDITCDTVLHVSPTARIYGDIKTSAIIVDEGGQLNGHYLVGERAAPAISTKIPPLLQDSSKKASIKN